MFWQEMRRVTVEGTVKYAQLICKETLPGDMVMQIHFIGDEQCLTHVLESLSVYSLKTE